MLKHAEPEKKGTGMFIYWTDVKKRAVPFLRPTGCSEVFWFVVQ
jgi:hypothetical protein